MMTIRSEFIPSHRLVRAATAAAVAAIFAVLAAPSLAATFSVNTTGDTSDAAPGDGSCFTGLFVEISPGLFGPACTLRAAIEEANALAGSDTITFAATLPKTAGFVEIFPTSALPTITSQILIDGYSADGYGILDPEANPVVNLGGAQAGAGTNGLVVSQGGSGTVLRGLAIFSFDGEGIVLSSIVPQALVDVRIEGCHIGIWRGLFYQGNGRDGIDVRAARDVVIGIDCDSAGCSGRRNVITASGENGVHLQLATFAQVGGNVIGTNPNGTATFVPFGGSTPNGGWGIRIFGGSRNTLGGTREAERNLVSGNVAGGIQVESSTANSILGNSIGTNRNGDQSLGNGGYGVDLDGGSNFVGSMSPGASNLISGNDATGIHSVGSNVIHSNTIGLDLDQSAALPNGWDGIALSGSGARVDRNVIAGNGRHGLYVVGDSHEIVANFVGTNATGDDLANDLNGIIVTAAESVQIGNAGEGNVVGFQAIGIGISFAAGPNFIQGNFIGTNPAGAALPNAIAGVYVSQSSGQVIGAVDGLDNGLANVIGRNQGSGVQLSLGPVGAPGNFVIGNFIGTDANDTPLGNDGPGIRIYGNANAIGAGAADSPELVVSQANVIAHNGGPAVTLQDGAIGNAVRGNVLYANGAGAAIDLADDGNTPNDVGDVDAGSNRLQNHPEFLASQTQWNETTGDLEVRYRVDTNEGDASYPLRVDFYLRTEYDSEAEVYVGSDDYPAASATLYRSVAITPQPDVLVEGVLVATATDADGNTSEISTQLIPVPEPALPALLASGIGLVGLLGGRRSEQGGRTRTQADARLARARATPAVPTKATPSSQRAGAPATGTAPPISDTVQLDALMDAA